MASGDLLGGMTASANEAPASAFATFDTRNAHAVLDFDDTTDEEAVFKFYLPPHYAAGGITVDLYASATSATSGDVVWQVQIERVTTDNQDIDSDGFAALNTSGAVTTNGTSGNVSKYTVTFTNGADMDSLAAGEWGRLKVRRDADNTSATDDLSGDMELWSITVTET